MTEYLQFVPHHEIEAFQSRGWVVVNDMADSHHGFWSVLMVDKNPVVES